MDHDEKRFILISGVDCYVYDLNDRTSASMVWMQIHQSNHAKLTEIADNTELSIRTLQRWHAAFKQDGGSGLIPKPRSGRPRTISNVDRELAVMLINSGRKPARVVKQLGFSHASLKRILADHEPVSDSETDPVANQVGQKSKPNPEYTQPQRSVTHSYPPTDPGDRSVDRAYARLGIHYDADPVFATDERIEAAGFFMFVALLDQTQVLNICKNTYQRCLGPAFYGLRTTVMTILFMLVTRIKRPEQLRHHSPVNLGKPLGLDRIMEVKTLLEKLGVLAGKNQGIALMEELGGDRFNRRSAPSDDQLDVLYIDGHVNCYVTIKVIRPLL